MKKVYVFTVIVIFLLAYIIAIGLNQGYVSELGIVFNKPTMLYSINDGNQDSLIRYSKLKRSTLDSIQLKYDWNEFDEYDNRLWVYMDEVLYPSLNEKPSDEKSTLWNEMTREQKVFWTYLEFSGEVDNGGIHQFFFNNPELAIAAYEMCAELSFDQLESDYKSLMVELFGLKQQDGKLSQEEILAADVWNHSIDPFSEHKKQLKYAEKIQGYFYDKEYSHRTYKQVSDYIEKNIDKFVIIQ